jgi:hypothetical protein
LTNAPQLLAKQHRFKINLKKSKKKLQNSLRVIRKELSLHIELKQTPFKQNKHKSTMKQQVKNNITLITLRFTVTELNRNNKRGTEKPNLWEKGDHCRLYVPTNAWKTATTYIDLNSGEVVGKDDILHVVEFIKNLS